MRRTIWIYWILTFLYRFSMSFVMPVYVLFLLSHGLNLLQINLVNMIFYLSLFFTEIPTGAFADIFGRKKACIMSCLFFGIGLVAYVRANSVWGFGLAESIIGTGATFANGAYQAWMVDRLKHFGHQFELKPILAKAQQSQQIGIMVGAILGGILAQRFLMLPWIVAALCMLLNLGMILALMREEYFVPKDTSFWDNIILTKNTVISGIKASGKNQVIKFILLMGFVQMFAVQAPNMQWQPYFGRFLPGTISISVLFAAMSMTVGIGAMLSPALSRLIKNERKAIITTQAVIGLCIAGAALFSSFGLILGVFLLHEIGRGMYIPARDAYLNDHIDSAERATLLSCASVSNHIGGVFGLLVSGTLAQTFSIETAWIISGFCLLLIAFKQNVLTALNF